MDFVLISTSDVTAGRSGALDRLLKSVTEVVESRPDISISALVLLQRCPADSLRSDCFPSFVDVSTVPYQMPVSEARNVLLLRALSRGLIRPETIVGFPDDDCWYPGGTLEYIGNQFSRNPKLDLWLCRYSSRPLSASDLNPPSRPASVRDVIRQASANTIFVRGHIVRSGASFDEHLGLGTVIGGEDTEFALRAHILSRQTAYLDAAIVGHRDRTRQLRAKYYRGGLMAIARNTRGRVDIVIELVRKIVVGVCLVLRGELSFAGFVGALSAAFGAWRIGGPKLMVSDGTESPQ